MHAATGPPGHGVSHHAVVHRRGWQDRLSVRPRGGRAHSAARVEALVDGGQPGWCSRHTRHGVAARAASLHSWHRESSNPRRGGETARGQCVRAPVGTEGNGREAWLHPSGVRSGRRLLPKHSETSAFRRRHPSGLKQRSLRWWACAAQPCAFESVERARNLL